MRRPRAVEPRIILVVVAIVFVAALTRSTFGFGEALVGMPLLSVVVDVRFAATLIALSATLNALTILLSDWRAVEWHGTWRLAIATLVGVPLGVLGVDKFPEMWIKLILAFVVIGFAVYSFLKPALLQLHSDRTAPAFGLAAGILGGAYMTLGPPLVIFATLRGWDPRQFRSKLQGVFFPTSIFICLNYYWDGRWNGNVFTCLLASLPAMALGLWVGWCLNRRFSTMQFQRCVFALLLASGMVLVASVVRDAVAEPVSASPVRGAVELPASTRTGHELADRPVRPATARA